MILLRPAHRAFGPLALLVTLVAGCGGEERAPLSSTKHNAADVAFATEMMQHHAQALALVSLSVDRPVAQEFAALTDDIRAAQVPEIETMTDWLEGWDEDVPQTVNDHMNHDLGTTPEGTEDMPGMLTADEMRDLEEASDAQFEEVWLEMMIRHHEGALEMARDEVADGRFRPAVELASSIIKAQRREISEMKSLLAVS